MPNRSGFGTRSEQARSTLEPGPLLRHALAWQVAALVQSEAEISWQERKVRCSVRGRRSAFARVGVDCMAGAALSPGQMSWQAQGFVAGTQRFPKAKCRFCGMRRTFVRSGADILAGTALLHSYAQIARQTQSLRRVKCDFVVGAAKADK